MGNLFPEKPTGVVYRWVAGYDATGPVVFRIGLLERAKTYRIAPEYSTNYVLGYREQFSKDDERFHLTKGTALSALTAKTHKEIDSLYAKIHELIVRLDRLDRIDAL